MPTSDSSPPAREAGPPVDDARQRLLQHFSVPEDHHGAKWAELWDRLDFLPWDKGTPSPALEDLLRDRGQELGVVRANATESSPKLRALVPGCGRGYDVVLFGSYGLDAYGLDISSKAVEEAQAYATSKTKDSDTEYGHVEFVAGDFYKDEWCHNIGVNEGEFDIAYDYTFLCAMPPSKRPAWAERMAKLLKPGSGLLICLEFPLYKPLETGGPPWGLKSEVYEELLGGAFERIMHFKPERTHPIGEGTDWISVWKRKET